VIPLELNMLEPLGRLVSRPWADVVTGMQVDSRRIEEGDLFVAVDGGRDFVEHAFARGLILNWTLHRDTVVRLVPPLVITDRELDDAVARIADSL